MKREVLLGDEAVALAAIHAGIRGVFSYPGTPATEILEYVQQHGREYGVYAEWSANEKVAYEEALGVSYAGERSLVSMKHVGLNVAADPFINSALTGAHGGLVLAVADDPGMHSSQNEQDSRYFSELAMITTLEPGNQQQAYDMTLEAFELSERQGLPVMIRLVTRLAHSRANVAVRDCRTPAPSLGVVAHPEDWTLIPRNARRRFRVLTDKAPEIAGAAEESAYNLLELRGKKGIIACGLAYNYVMESIGAQTAYSMLRIGHYPPPRRKIRALMDHCDEALVVEDGYPFVESHLRGVCGVPGKRILGKVSGELPRTGELNPDLVRRAFGLADYASMRPIEGLSNRPPALCRGCPHSDSFRFLNEALEPYPRAVVFSDIGCYALGALPPYNAIHSCVDMGASIGMAHGASIAGVKPSLCAIGDSTFVHSGITALIGAARRNANIKVLILDNSAIAMTGGQETMAEGEDIVRVVKGLGVDPEHVVVVHPLPKHHQQNVAAVRKELEYEGLSVIISARACIQIRKPASGGAAEKSPITAPCRLEDRTTTAN